jgi:hypothetical protein
LRCCGVMCTEADVPNATAGKLPTPVAAFSAGPCWSTTGGRRLMPGGPVCLRWFDPSRPNSSPFPTIVSLRLHILAHTHAHCKRGRRPAPDLLTPVQSCDTKQSSPALCLLCLLHLFAVTSLQNSHLPLDAPCFCPLPRALCKANISGRVKPSRDYMHTKLYTNASAQALEHTQRANSSRSEEQ